MQIVKVFIDHVGFGPDVDFSDLLFKSLGGIRNNLRFNPTNELSPERVILTRYTQLKHVNENNTKYIDDTIEAIEEADIIIPIISPDFLATITDRVDEAYQQATSKSTKRVLPFYYRESNFSEYPWIVRSSMVPDNSRPFITLSNEEQDSVLFLFRSFIGNISMLVGDPKFNFNDEFKDQKLKNKYFFISHSHVDSEFVENIELRLEREGIDTWIDRDRIKMGDNWKVSIDEGIQNSKGVIVVMSPAAKSSEYVTYEWSFALGQGVDVFPIMLKDTTLHPKLADLQYLDFSNKASRPWAQFTQKIKDHLKNSTI